MIIEFNQKGYVVDVRLVWLNMRVGMHNEGLLEGVNGDNSAC